jgi:hypothetical protein
MTLSLQHRYAMLLAGRARDVRTVTTVVTEVLEANPDTSPLDIQTAIRTANGQAYLVGNRQEFASSSTTANVRNRLPSTWPRKRLVRSCATPRTAFTPGRQSSRRTPQRIPPPLLLLTKSQTRSLPVNDQPLLSFLRRPRKSPLRCHCPFRP